MLRRIVPAISAILIMGMMSISNAQNMKESLIFKASFDKDLTADTAKGSKNPVKHQKTMLVKGQYGSAVEIKGNAFLVYPAKDNFNPEAGTIMMWVKRGENSETMLTLGNRWYGKTFFTLRVSSKFNNIHSIFKKDGILLSRFSFAPPPAVDEWHHYTITWGNDKLILYVDGIKRTWAKMPKNWSLENLPAEIWVGSSGDGRYQANSAIDELKIYNKALSLKEILSEEKGLKKKLINQTVSGEAVRNYTWKDWNSTSTPAEGKHIAELYECNKYIIAKNNYHRFEFSLEQKAHDAYVIYSGLCDAKTRHTIKTNGTAIFSKIGQEAKDADKAFIIPVKNLHKGANVITFSGCWASIELVVNLADGTQADYIAGPGWQSTNQRLTGWEQVNFEGVSEALVYRLGHEGYHQHQNGFNSRPYVGLIELKQDKDNYPVYRQGSRMNWQVSIPEDFYGKTRPELTGTLTNCWTGQVLPSIKGRFIKKQNGKTTYQLSTVLNHIGAYNVELSFGAKTGMKRKAELVVYGKVKQPEVRAAQIFSSLNKTLIDKIDCTRLNNKKYPVILGGAIGSVPSAQIIKNGRLKYFQTGSAAGFLTKKHLNNYAMWRLHPDKLNQFYLLEIDIPNDKDRVQIIALVHGIAGYECGTETTVEIGMPRPTSKKLVTHRLLFVPKFKDVRVMISPVSNSRQHNGAAVAAIRFFRINGPLPAVKLGNSKRESSNYNERANLPAFSYYPGSDSFTNFHGKCLTASNQYRRWYLALQNHIEILKMSAQNAVCHGLYMYVKKEYPTLPEQTDFVRMMQDMYGQNNIAFYANSQYFTSEKLESRKLGHKVHGTKLSDEDVINGAATCRLVSKEGKQATGYPMNNPCSPQTQADLIGIFDDIGKKYAAHKNFKGMMIFAGTMGCAMSFRDLNWGYGDCTYNLFRQSSRQDAPDFKGAGRFNQRYKWIMSNAKTDFIKFRCRELYQFNRKLLDILQKYSPEAKLIVNMCVWPWRKNIGSASVSELEQRLLGTGADPALYRADPDMLVMHNDWMGAHIQGRKELELVERYNNNPEVWKFVTADKPAAVFFWTGYYETRLYLPPAMLNQYWLAENWFFNYEKRFIGSAGKLGRDYLSAYTNALTFTNPVLFVNRFTDVAEHRGFVDMKAEAGEALSYIPEGTYKTAAGSTAKLALRYYSKHAYLVNNSSKELIVKINFGSQAEVINKVTGSSYQINNGVVGFRLKKYQILPLQLKNIDKSALKIEKQP
jgi:predicted RNA-binding protein associated with RNAse of E/G family